MTAYRMLFLSASAVLILGIWLTGFDRAHWILYLPAAGFAVAGVTGWCMMYRFWRLLGFRA